MTLRKNIAVFAGAWGYGPVTTAAQVVRALGMPVTVTFIGGSIAADYARMPDSEFHRVLDIPEFIDHAANFDGIISVVEPYGPLFGSALHVPVVAIDNLFWHWGWDYSLASSLSERLPEHFLARDVPSIVESLADLPGYGVYALMYLMASRVLWQNVATPPPSTPQWMHELAAVIEPIVDVHQQPDGYRKQGTLVSLSGGLVNPYSTAREWDTYLDALEQLFEPFPHSSGWTWVAPPELHARIRDRWPGVYPRALTQQAFLEELSRAEVCLAPAGLGTTFEAAAANTPLITLPEQHDGNWANYEGLSTASGCSEEELYRVYPNLLLSSSAPELRGASSDELFRWLDSATLEAGRPGSFFDQGRSMLQRSFSQIAAGRSRLASDQAGLVSSFGGGLQGASQAALICRDIFGL